MLDKTLKEKIIKKFGTHPGDTGSTEVQIALLSEEINLLLEHLKTHKKDFSSRRGLLRKVNQRRRLLRYLERESTESFDKLVKALKLKVKKTEMKPEEEGLSVAVEESKPEETEKTKIN